MIGVKLAHKLARKYLSYTDRTGEVAFAVIMVIIINGYVALSDLNTGFLYLVVVNLGACGAWGFIDGFLYAISSSIERNSIRIKLTFLKSLSKEKEQDVLSKVESSLDETFLSSFDKDGKEAIAKEIITHVHQASVENNEIFTKDEAMGWLSIILIYLTTGFVLALPFLVFSDKLFAWFISNFVGVLWLFWYGVQLGKSVGKYRLLLGLSMAGFGILFLAVSYIVWVLG
jgi:VIT1/CCC1 family predicted Fe2+/Mn2+ transporter